MRMLISNTLPEADSGEGDSFRFTIPANTAADEPARVAAALRGIGASWLGIAETGQDVRDPSLAA